MSRASSLQPIELMIFQTHARDGMKLYGLAASDVVDHSCKMSFEVLRDTRPDLACPCGRFEKKPNAQLIRHALVPQRPIAYASAVAILRLISYCRKTTLWRNAWRSTHPEQPRDRWDLANAKIWPRLAFEANFKNADGSRMPTPGYRIGLSHAFFAYASPLCGKYETTHRRASSSI